MIAITALTGCDAALERAARELHTSTSVQPPQPALAEDPVVALARPSVAKVRAQASSCQKLLEGTGFVVAPNTVLTAAHVVAGSDTVTVDFDGTAVEARVVSYDSNADLAIIDAPGLSAQPLSFAVSPVTTDTDALVLGYPNGGPFVATPARVREIIDLRGPDIYRTSEVTREVYIIDIAAAASVQGVSGGPLIDMEGRVFGVFFGAQVERRDTGFALTAAQVAPQLATIGNTQPVTTGACIS